MLDYDLNYLWTRYQVLNAIVSMVEDSNSFTAVSRPFTCVDDLLHRTGILALDIEFGTSGPTL